MMNSNDENVQPNVIHFNSVLKSCARNCNTQRAERILQQMWSKVSEDAYTRQGGRRSRALNVTPNTISYNTVISAWANSASSDSAERVTKFLSDMYQKGIPSNTRTYCAVIYAVSKTRNPGSQAETLLRDMMKRHATTVDVAIAPTMRTFNADMNAWSNTQDPLAANNASALLEELWELYRQTKMADLKPDISTYNSLLKILSNKKGRGAAKEATRLLSYLWSLYKISGDEVLKPNLITYSSIIKTWSNSGSVNAGEEASAPLADKWKQSEAGHHSLQPDQITFGSLLNAWANSKSEVAGEKTSAILSQLWDLYHQGYRHLGPDKKSYNPAIRAFSHCDDSKTAIQQATGLVTEMWHYYEKGFKALKPDAITYSSLITAFSRSGADPALCESVMRDLWQIYHEQNDPRLKPDVKCYSNVMNAYVQSGHSDAAGKTMELLREMQGLSLDGHFELKPDRIVFNSVIEAHQASNQPNAHRTIDRLKMEMAKAR